MADHRALRFLLLLGASAALAGSLEWIGLPAGMLLGPMIVGILFAVRGWAIRIPDLAFWSAQAIVGCLIASSMTAGIAVTVAHHLVLFLATTAATLAASAVIGALSSRWQLLPGTVAVWGAMPGAATAMVLMARAFGADARLVAVMTYTRVVCVAAVASILAALLSGHYQGVAASARLFAAVDWTAVAVTLAVATTGAAAGVLLRIPAGALIGAMLLGAVLTLFGVVRLELPGWLLAISYAVVGWRIGLGFSREIVASAARAMPRILISIFALIAFCGALAFGLSRVTGVDLVTAYLATSPGGMDSVAIIAASTPVDVPFVMALQVLRFVAVLLFGPALARTIAVRQGSKLPAP